MGVAPLLPTIRQAHSMGFLSSFGLRLAAEVWQPRAADSGLHVEGNLKSYRPAAAAAAIASASPSPCITTCTSVAPKRDSTKFTLMPPLSAFPPCLAASITMAKTLFRSFEDDAPKVVVSWAAFSVKKVWRRARHLPRISSKTRRHLNRAWRYSEFGAAGLRDCLVGLAACECSSNASQPSTGTSPAKRAGEGPVPSRETTPCSPTIPKPSGSCFQEFGTGLRDTS
mmetsp:Transcript_92463/g.193298  ORF Transcript_92463/g.193298 Transcript_92463/m.193298 type:complete len:226 (-) Transcript_92463:2307-2984(-)